MTTQHPPQQKQQSNLGIISLVLGIVSIFMGFGALTAIPGLIVGIVSLAKKEPNKGLAIGGIVTSIIGILLTILLLLFMSGILYAVVMGWFQGAAYQR